MLRDWPLGEFDALYERMRRDFPRNERPPKHSLGKQIKTGALKAYGMDTEDLPAAAYALCAGRGGVLITHLAVAENSRGKGYGSMLLKELKEQYQRDSSCLIVEVEWPHLAQCEAEKVFRAKRIAFYNRSGYDAYESISYHIFGVPMMLMAQPLNGNPLPGEQALKEMVRDAYKQLLPPFLMGQVRFD